MEDLREVCYMVTKEDNVATAMADLDIGDIKITGDVPEVGYTVKSVQKIPFGHKIALRDIKKGEGIIKYGVVIGISTGDIQKGCHVHMHNMKSAYDYRSAELDPLTVHARDIEYKAY